MIELQDVKKSFSTQEGRSAAVQGISLDVPDGSFFVLLGPSGCGKTTTMRLLAGLERPDAGRIVMGGEVVAAPKEHVHVPTNKRNIGMVFQSYAIWPHMSVAQNVGYPLKVKRVPRARVATMVEEVLGVVGLEGLGSRSATRLSGGQQQRVALARALVAKPDVLLLDEPLSNLDARLRIQMRAELKRIQAMLGITTVYVTHDQSEALSMADEIAVMSHGFVMQQGVAADIFHRPRNRFTASFIGSSNLLPVRHAPSGIQEGLNAVETDLGSITAVSEAAGSEDDGFDVCIRPQRIALEPWGADPAAGSPNSFAGTIEEWAFLGEDAEGVVRVGDHVLQVRCASDVVLDLPVGSKVRASVDPRHCRLISNVESGSGLAAEAAAESRLHA